MFEITDGKGFKITFNNGYTVSVQFGPANYGSNYKAPWDAHRGALEWTAEMAEVAVMDADGFVRLEDESDDVIGYQTAADVLSLLRKVADWPKKEKTE